ncbi:hypothetical protein PBI_MRMAGOO_12 [Mycobacterium phage MrMagoo]|uniref:Uncharacterized protein n=1 Tax=Mycobacterium phage MrMagoo TaxID=1927020 RepID=A0A1L6BYE4_9CAUD|nr:hypothetical protein J4U04_gp012 [Mycobacterium phage MrMagoo]APQ42117.1 hypothetical protein PBI_MRMAGOO_12 [Mycobacterium phage MrMagoo]ARM70193.1 hypothetical protein SEA_GARDENSALSA_12 [Mycobacterium phage GardenSalsa]
MSAQVSVLVEFKDGKPSLAINGVSRSYTRKGSAVNYASDIEQSVKRRNAWNIGRGYHSLVEPEPDIRILTLTIPDEGPVGDGIWPELVPEVAVEWS